jgi:DNA-binding transcriptional regulator YhcF (GntR family)
MKTNPFDQLNLVAVDECSGIPKYEQIVKIILSDIENGIFKRGEQIPSINETSYEFYISRDTVEKAYKKLKELGAIISVRGKGYFVSERTDNKMECFLMITESYGEKIAALYKEMRDHLKINYQAELFLHIGNPVMLKQSMKSQICNYRKYIFISDSDTASPEMKEALNCIPENKLVLFQNNRFSTAGKIVAPQLDSGQLYNLMDDLLQDHYRKVIVLYPGNNLHFGVMDDVINYCLDNSIVFEVANSSQVSTMKKGSLFMVWEQDDLKFVLGKCQQQGFQPGKEVGVICMSDLPMCDFLAGGITRILPDKELLNKVFAMALGLCTGNEKINFTKIQRNSA